MGFNSHKMWWGSRENNQKVGNTTKPEPTMFI